MDAKGRGEKFLRMAGAADVDAARALWKDPATPTHRRCLAARAVGFLGKHGPSWKVEGVEDDCSPLGRARRHGARDAERRKEVEDQFQQREVAVAKMTELALASIPEVIRLLQNRSETLKRRIVAAQVLEGFRCREGVDALIETLAEGDQRLSWQCMWALTRIESRRGARRLIEIARGPYPLPARQEAINTLWQLNESRGEQLFIRLSAAVETEDWYTRDMATEALGNSWRRPRSQRAIAERLFDPCVSVRYAALCACRGVNAETLPSLRHALEAKLSDPEKVDDNRVIAVLAADRLNSPCRL